MSEPTAAELESQERMRETPDARRGGDYRPDCKACRELVAHTRHVLDSEPFKEVQAEANPQPDLRTLDGALDFLDYHSPDPAARAAHEIVNKNFQALLSNVWQNIPDGPGRTVFVRDLNRARMSAVACRCYAARYPQPR